MDMMFAGLSRGHTAQHGWHRQTRVMYLNVGALCFHAFMPACMLACNNFAAAYIKHVHKICLHSLPAGAN